MTLIKSISGIRGTIGDHPGEGLTPIDIVKFTAAYAQWVKNKAHLQKYLLVIGRDARPSGNMVSHAVTSTLSAMGFDIVDLGVTPTPTVEIAVKATGAMGGIILTASHNPIQWNALKLLNQEGEFISDADGKAVLDLAEKESFVFVPVENLGHSTIREDLLNLHIEQILQLDLVDVETIKKAHFKVAVDGINSAGGIAVPKLLKKLGINEIIELNCEPNGQFAHNPEPLPSHLTEISGQIKNQNADLGFVVDPDVDRLAIVNEDGSMFGEEYTLVAVADYVLQHQKGTTVSNLSSSRALKDVAAKHGCEHIAAAVGEVNVVKAMKQNNAVIGGEGNGGVIYPQSHYGRDALVGIALFLSHLAQSGQTCSELRQAYPDYTMIKDKKQLSPDIEVHNIFKHIKKVYAQHSINETDGLKIEFDREWVHLRTSNTEPIMRIYAESTSQKAAQKLVDEIKQRIEEI